MTRLERQAMLSTERFVSLLHHHLRVIDVRALSPAPALGGHAPSWLLAQP